jgi:hypothetical protein
MPHLSEIVKGRIVSHLENGRTMMNVTEFGVEKRSRYLYEE